jgi:zinc transporter 1/2/3
MMNVVLFKYFTSVIIFSLNLASSAVPLFFTSLGWISKAECLAGGVFLGSALVHLVPEALHSFEGFSEYPIASLIILACFSLLLVVEVFAQTHGEHSDSSHQAVDGQLSSMIIVLYCVLIFHGFVEAIAFGIVKQDSIVLALFCAIIGHKPVETFALGLEILKNRPSRLLYFAMMILFSSVAPLTIVFTVWIEKTASNIFAGLVTSASAGAFLFVGCHEVTELLHEAGKWSVGSKIVHLLFFALGATWMALFAFMEG